MADHDNIKMLYDNRFMSDESQIEAFYDALHNMDDQTNTVLTHDLLLVFNDSCEHAGGMMSLTHYVEHFSNYVEKLVGTTPDMYPHAKKQLNKLYNRILNSEYSRKELVAALLSVAPKTKEMVIEILNGLANQFPASQGFKVAQILSEIN